ncbi:MAG: EAL domain-containing protein [Gammaproteobacteria bacterium]
MNKWLTSISNRISLGYGAILLITVITAIPLISTNYAVSGKVSSFIKETLPQLSTFRSISSDLKQLEINAYSLYGLTLSSNEFDLESKIKINSIWQHIGQINSANTELNQRFREFVWHLKIIRSTMGTQPVAWETARKNLADLSNASSQLNSLIDQYTKALSLSTESSSTNIINEMSLVIKLIFTLMTVILMVAIAAFLHSRKHISEPIKHLAVMANKITHGNFDTKVKITRNDEIGKLAEAVHHMQTGIAKREERILKYAHFDELTGLANSVLMTDRITHAISRAERNQTVFSLVLLNVKRFKDINNAFGHALGDAVIKEVSKRVLNNLRGSDSVARANGDKFLILLDGTDKAAAIQCMTALIAKLKEPIELDSTTIILSLCSGIVSYPEQKKDANELLRQAEIAMNEAKEHFAEVSVFESSNDACHLRQLSIIRDLREAVQTDQFLLNYQPKINVGTNEVVGVEALIRWIHPELGFMPPDEFIPIAERSGNISLITYWVLRKAIEQCHDWNQQGLHIKMSVNLSTIDLLDQELPKVILKLLEEYNVEPSQIVLEITESTFVRDTDLALQLLNQIRDAGINLSIDDYGTGFSSLAKLRELPVQELKIDKSFVMNMQDNENDTVIVKSTIDLGHNMGLRITAEGVEDQATLELLNELGCDEIQGYFISRPLPINEFTPWISAYVPAKNNLEVATES